MRGKSKIGCREEAGKNRRLLRGVGLATIISTYIPHVAAIPYRFQFPPFSIPLGALLPQHEQSRTCNKNIGTTHITNGCYRLHPVEWSIGEAVGSLIAFARNKKVPLKAVREHRDLLEEFQSWIRCQGIETHWPI